MAGDQYIYELLGFDDTNTIWDTRTDLKEVYQAAGWPTETFSNKVAILNNWWYEIKPAETQRFVLLADYAAYLRTFPNGFGTGDRNKAQRIYEKASPADVDTVWRYRPDLSPFYVANGWTVASYEDQLTCLNDWFHDILPGSVEHTIFERYRTIANYAVYFRSGDGWTGWLEANPLVVVGIVAGAYLLFEAARRAARRE